MFQSENQGHADSEALGFHAVLRRVHEPVFESIFWLALGCVLGWQDKECFERVSASEDTWHDRRTAKKC
jgi:hypothetical protein